MIEHGARSNTGRSTRRFATTAEPSRPGRPGLGRWWTPVALLAVGMLASACADLGATSAAVGPEDGGAIAETTASPGSTTTTDATDTVGAKLGTTELGEVLVGPDGRSLYAFTNDTQAASTCYGTCAEDWPPVIVDPDWDVAPQLDSGIFATTVRDDGQLQLVASKWPLYYYVGDIAPGDIEGQGVGGVWYLVDPTGTLVEADPTAQTEPADEPESTPDSSTDTSTGGGYDTGTGDGY